MTRTCSIAVAIIATFVLLQTAEAYPRGGGRSFGSAHFSAPHFSAPRISAPHYSAPSYRASAPSRSFSSAATRHYAPRTGAMPNHRSHAGPRTRFAPTTGVRNPAYTSVNGRFNGNRTTAFNSRNVSPTSNARFRSGNRSIGARGQDFNGGRVVARHNAKHWNRHWDRGRDHNWHGRRCHYHNGYWFIYDPFPYYPYWGFYPYTYYDSSYYDPAYYDDSYATDQSAPASYTNNNRQPEYAMDSRVNEVQSALAREGYYDGPIDGRFGPGTRRALRNYQRDHNLQITGNIDQALIEALRLR